MAQESEWSALAPRGAGDEAGLLGSGPAIMFVRHTRWLMLGWLTCGCAALLDLGESPPSKGDAIGGMGGEPIGPEVSELEPGLSEGGAEGKQPEGSDSDGGDAKGSRSGGANSGEPSDRDERPGSEADGGSGATGGGGSGGGTAPSGEESGGSSALGGAGGEASKEFVPLNVIALTMSPSGRHSCAVSDEREVYCWGGPGPELGLLTEERIGDDETPAGWGPVRVGGPVSQVTAGNFHTCALHDDGTVRCWGWWKSIGLGGAADVGDDEPPAQYEPLPLQEKVLQIDAGASHTCAVLESRRVVCWGRGEYGRLGYGTEEDLGDDETLEGIGTVLVGGDVLSVSAGEQHTCAVLLTGEVRCWGYGRNYRLGYGSERNYGDNESPAAAGSVPLPGPAKAVYAGDHHSCAVLESGALHCWGEGSYGELGYPGQTVVGDQPGETPETMGPIQLGAPVLDVALGEQHTCALLEGGSIRCFGFRSPALGMLPPSNIGDDEHPAKADAVPVGGNASFVVAGGSATCALLETYRVQCWGSNVYGELGYGHQEPIGDDETPKEAGDLRLGQLVER